MISQGSFWRLWAVAWPGQNSYIDTFCHHCACSCSFTQFQQVYGDPLWSLAWLTSAHDVSVCWNIFLSLVMILVSLVCGGKRSKQWCCGCNNDPLSISFFWLSLIYKQCHTCFVWFAWSYLVILCTEAIGGTCTRQWMKPYPTAPQFMLKLQCIIEDQSPPKRTILYCIYMHP